MNNAAKKNMRARVARDTAEFLKSGGQITKVKPGVSTAKKPEYMQKKLRNPKRVKTDSAGECNG